MGKGSVLNVSGASKKDLTGHLNDKGNPHGVTAAQTGAIPSAEKGAAWGVATLGSDGKVPSEQLPPLNYDQVGSAAAVKTQLDTHTANKSNPHGVTVAQVGLDKVPNVATNDQTPTYTAASTLAALTSGEKLSAAFGKLAKAVSDLIAHLANKSNPHGVTPTQIGAAATNHGTHVSYSTTNPVMAGAASPGSASTVARSDHVHPAQTTITGNAATATKLATARTIRTNLGSATAVSFDGSGNVTPGVTGTLPVDYGGTGLSSLTGTDYTTSRVRGISFSTSTPSSISNGHVVLVYT